MAGTLKRIRYYQDRYACRNEPGGSHASPEQFSITWLRFSDPSDWFNGSFLTSPSMFRRNML